jgi:glycosyltransferase involved in cell wall biosynthesis
MKKVAYIVSNIDKALAFEWVASYIDKTKFDLFFILINPASSELEEYLKKNDIKVYRISYSSKKDLLSGIYQCTNILRKEKAEVIHCHLFAACMIGLISGKLLGIKKRIYTRHHAMFHLLNFPRAVYIDKLMNFLATDIIAISQNVKEILIQYENVKEDKIREVHHGFVLEHFGNPDAKSIASLKLKYNPDNKMPVIGVISRYTEGKGIQYTIAAFKKLLRDFPEAYLILANAGGNYASEIKNLLKEIPEKNFCEIKFENDIFSLYFLFDVFIHVPLDQRYESFGQVYIEALAAGIPSIFTLSGIAPEFIKDGENALVVDFKKSDQIYHSAKKLLNDKKLRNSLSEKGKESVKGKFNIYGMINKLEAIYGE